VDAAFEKWGLTMVYSGIADAYRDFMGVYLRPACCGRIHWGPEDVESWLRRETRWDGVWNHLSPALILRASLTALQTPCPRQTSPCT
jgi:hypothetical protein